MNEDYTARAEKAFDLLNAVFPGIIVDTQEAQKLRLNRENPEATPLLGWRMNGNILTLAIDLPSWHERELPAEILWRLNRAYGTASEEVRASLPHPADVVSAGYSVFNKIRFKIEHLQQLKNAGITLTRDLSVTSIMDTALRHEAAWKNYCVVTTEQTNHLLLGLPFDRKAEANEDDPPRISFSFSESNGHVSLKLPLCENTQEFTLPPPYGRGEGPHPKFSQLQDFLEASAQRHGVQDLIAYQTYSDRDSAQQFLVIQASCVEELCTKLHDLEQPETRDAARAFIFETYCMLPAKKLFNGSSDNPAIDKATAKNHPWTDNWDELSSSEREEIYNARCAYKDELRQKPQNIAWKAFVDSIIDQSMTIGEVVVLLNNPSDDQRGVSEAVKDHLLQRLPLLSLGFPEPERSPTLRQGAGTTCGEPVIGS